MNIIQVVLLILIIGFSFMLSLTAYHVHGLRGGYNKGAWSESSFYMRREVKMRDDLIKITLLLLGVFIFSLFNT